MRPNTAKSENDKLEALSSLRVRIINDLFVEQWRDVWFFPERDGVRGWQGAQDIIFVALNPSYGGGSASKAFNSFYQELRLNGFMNAHLTDISKVRARGKEVKQVLQDAALMDKQKLYLLEEIDIIQPRLLVPMGKRTTEALQQWLPRSKVSGPSRTMRPDFQRKRTGASSPWLCVR